MSILSRSVSRELLTAVFTFPWDFSSLDEVGGLDTGDKVNLRVEGEAACGEVCGIHEQDTWLSGRHDE
jgi:hypothetical protein